MTAGREPTAGFSWLEDADRATLLDLARHSIESHVARTTAPVVPATGAAARPGGAFVSLHRLGSLRGCIGHIEADAPLGHIVARCAVAAASSDPRFPPVTITELADLRVELSVLAPLEPIAGPEAVEVGRHGLVIERGWNRGLLLPQVAVEWAWDAERFVAETCRKAGLPHSAWREGALLYRFEADVFGER